MEENLTLGYSTYIDRAKTMKLFRNENTSIALSNNPVFKLELFLIKRK